MTQGATFGAAWAAASAPSEWATSTAGRVLSVNSVNARRAGENERVADWEDAVFLAFDPAAAILLKD